MDLEATTSLAHGIRAFTNPLTRKKCEPYDVSAVADAVRSMHTPDDPVLSAVSLDMPPTVRAAFHDAADYNKWSATGGADGRFYNQPEAWYAQSRSVNAGLVCPQKLMGFFNETSLSPGDAIQICAMVSVELAGGPTFEDFGFEPGRVLATGVSQDGGLPGALGNNKSLRDYFYRAGMDDIDIVALSGAHTLGRGVAPGGFSGAFTLTPDIFSNDYFQNLIAYENVTDYGCNYFAPGSTPESRANTGCHPTNQDNENGGIMQLPTDRALLLDEGLCQYVVTFANDEDAFFEQFVKSMKKMSELGRDVSVQWCNYDPNYVESMPTSAHASATKPSSAMNVPSVAYQAIV
jgi:L-ascorbate peroxidase